MVPDAVESTDFLCCDILLPGPESFLLSLSVLSQFFLLSSHDDLWLVTDCGIDEVDVDDECVDVFGFLNDFSEEKRILT